MSAALSMFRAEWLKISGNRWTVAFLIWVFPIGALILMASAVLIALLSPGFRAEQQMLGIDPWYITLVKAWEIINNPVIGRPVILIFTAIVFAGEYQNGTWKNLIPLRTRVALILNKFVTLAVFITVSFVLMTIIVTIGTGVVAAVLDIDYGLGSAGPVVSDFLGQYFLQMFYVMMSTFIVSCFAALAAMMTRSVVAASIVAMIAYFFEALGVILFFLLVDLVTGLKLYGVYRFLPSFNLENIMSWVREDKGLLFVIGEVDYGIMSLAGSLLIVIAWVVALIALTIWRFQRQDITT